MSSEQKECNSPVTRNDPAKYSIRPHNAFNSLVLNKGNLLTTQLPRIVEPKSSREDTWTGACEGATMRMKARSGAFLIPQGDQAVEEEKAVCLNSPQNLTPMSAVHNNEKFAELVAQVLGNYLEERVCEREVLMSYAKYSEEQIKYKTSATYRNAAGRFASDKERCRRDLTKYGKGTTLRDDTFE